MDTAPSESSKGRGKSKRQWTTREDEKLVESLLDMCNVGTWKCENGFKPGYLLHLEKELQDKLPGCGLRANPHIESRVKLLKRQYGAIADMLNHGSGFGWDHERKMIICEKHIFDDWVKSHKDAAGLYNKLFPYYDQLGEIFGRDRANGLGAEGLADAVEDINQETVNNNSDNIFGGNGLDDIDVSVTQSPTVQMSEASGSKRSCRKRTKSTDALVSSFTELTSMLGTYLEDSKAGMLKLVDCFAHEQEAANKRSRVVDELMKVPGLSDIDVMDAAYNIASDPTKIDIFYSLPDNFKKTWVERQLGRD